MKSQLPAPPGDAKMGHRISVLGVVLVAVFGVIGLLYEGLNLLFTYYTLPKDKTNQIEAWLRGLYSTSASPIVFVLNFLLVVALLISFRRFRRAVSSSPRTGDGSTDRSVNRAGISGGVEVFKGWAEAYDIISSAKETIVIVDSFLVNEVGAIEGCVKRAIAQPGVKSLKVSVYLASPEKVFGAQRIREKENPQIPGVTKEGMTERYKQTLGCEISKVDRNTHIARFNTSYSAIMSHISMPRVELRVRTYPSMPTTRIFVIDDIDYIFGWFPLLTGNPEYVCCHLRDDGLSGSEEALARSLRDHIEIVESISDEAEAKPLLR